MQPPEALLRGDHDLAPAPFVTNIVGHEMSGTGRPVIQLAASSMTGGLVDVAEQDTRAPSSTSACASARPSPDAAPVTIATFPASRFTCCSPDQRCRA